MSHYKDINRELVEQVQSMRRNMKLYCDEIVYLKEELFQKHESELILRKKCINWAINNFIELIQFIQPDSDILPVLKQHIESRKSGFRCSDWSRKQKSGRSSGNSRRSSLLTKELQKSNTIINMRRSVCTTSPVRRRNSEENHSTEEEDEQNAQPFRQHTEEQENTVNAAIDNVIYEDFEEEDTVVQPVCESVEEVSSITVSMDSSDKENSVHDIEESLQDLRIHTNVIRLSAKNKSIPINDLREAFTDITGNIEDAVCSTPNSRSNSLLKTTSPSRQNYKSDLGVETTVFSEYTNSVGRPSRQCKPKDLKEPGLAKKLRGESTTKKRSRNKSQSKAKKK